MPFNGPRNSLSDFFSKRLYSTLPPALGRQMGAFVNVLAREMADLVKVYQSAATDFGYVDQQIVSSPPDKLRLKFRQHEKPYAGADGEVLLNEWGDVPGVDSYFPIAHANDTTYSGSALVMTPLGLRRGLAKPEPGFDSTLYPVVGHCVRYIEEGPSPVTKTLAKVRMMGEIGCFPGSVADGNVLGGPVYIGLYGQYTTTAPTVDTDEVVVPIAIAIGDTTLLVRVPFGSVAYAAAPPPPPGGGGGGPR